MFIKPLNKRRLFEVKDSLFLQYHCDLTEQNALVKPDTVVYQEWLDSLSRSKTLIAAEKLLESMKVFNRIELEQNLRQKLLHQYLQKIKLLSPNLQLEIGRAEGLAHETARRAASDIVSLYATLFEGLRILTAHRIQKPPLLNREQIKIELLARTLMSARETLLAAGRYHVAPPKNIWLYCHSIYLFMQSSGLLMKSYKTGSTLAELYAQVLLIGMIPQSRINEDSFDWLYQKLTSFAKRINILSLDKPSEKSNGFYFELTEDFPPRFFPRAPTSTPEIWRKVDCQCVIDDFNHEVEELDTQGKSFADEVVLMRLVLIEWCYSAHRRRVRNKVDEPIWFQTKIGSIWELVTQKEWRPGDILSGGRFVVHPSLMTKVDENEFGFGASGDPQGVSIQIGEIALTRTDASPSWTLSVVRWLMMNGNDLNISCGLEYITSDVKAIEIKPVLGSGNTYFTPALELPANPKAGKGRTLVLTGRVFSRLREFIIRYPDGTEVAVRLSRLTLQTSFYQFAEYLLSEDL